MLKYEGVSNTHRGLWVYGRLRPREGLVVVVVVVVHRSFLAFLCIHGEGFDKGGEPSI